MPTRASAAEIRADFDTIAALTPQDDVLGPYEEWLLTSLPSSRELAVEVGCGAGRLTRRLARAFAHVTGIDFSEGMIEQARRRSAGSGIEYVRGDLFEHLPAFRDRCDCAVSVATLHHVDLRAALLAMAAALKPGGKLLVIDLVDRRGWRYLPINGIAWLVSRMRGVGSRKLREAYLHHGLKETYLGIHEVKAIASEVLPGARVRAHLLWRYTIEWTKPLG
jgi:SAM-dependent methyltransferase